MYPGPSDVGGYGLGRDDYYSQQQGPGIMDSIKPHIKKIIVLIVIAVLGYYAYYYFIGCIQEVEFSVYDTEGHLISSADVSIYTTTPSEPLFEFEGSEKVNLRPGMYYADIKASGYKSKAGYEFEVSEAGNDPKSVVLEKDMDIELSIEEAFPTQLVKGQNFTFKIKATNNDSKPASIELVFEDAVKEDYMSMQYSSPIALQANSSEIVTINATVSEDPPKIEDNLEGTIRVKYLKPSTTKAEVEFNLLDFDEGKVRVRGSLSFGTLKSGETKKDDFTITNTNKNLVVTDISISLGNILAQNNDEEDVITWISVEPTSIPGLDYGSEYKETVVVEVSVPLNAKEDTISGEVVVKNDYYYKAVPFELDVEAAEVNLEITGIPAKYTLQYNDENFFYEEETDIWTIKNRGEVDISQISLAVQPECTLTWIEIEEDELELLEAGSSQDITVSIRAPASTEPDTTQQCTLRIAYNNPITLERMEMEKTITIETFD